ncbi:hypothetical protein, partial [Ochrobactrum sp. SFR4]|uniref:hypothetical protein n=1 Tax=Ochrobactrum sp. SFR4 TaxID=2717368 RepID=UPI001C8BF685
QLYKTHPASKTPSSNLGFSLTDYVGKMTATGNLLAKLRNSQFHPCIASMAQQFETIGSCKFPV